MGAMIFNSGIGRKIREASSYIRCTYIMMYLKHTLGAESLSSIRLRFLLYV